MLDNSLSLIAQTMFILPPKHLWNPPISFHLYFNHIGLNHPCLSPGLLLWLPNKSPWIPSFASSLPHSWPKSFENANFIDVFLQETLNRLPIVLKILNLLPWSTRPWITGLHPPWLPLSHSSCSSAFSHTGLLSISITCWILSTSGTCSSLCLDQSLPPSWPG